MLTKTTVKKALYRALKASITGALAAFVAVPVNLDSPKTYITILTVSIISGVLMGLQKLVEGYLKYDK